MPDLAVLDRYAFTDSLEFKIAKPLPDMQIRYTLDGSIPTNNATALNGSLSVNQAQMVRFAAFKNGRIGDVYDVAFDKQTWAVATKASSLKEGLIVDWYKKAFDSTSSITGTPDGTTTATAIIAPDAAKAESFTLRFKGYINVPEQGIYTFYLTSDDASFLRIADKNVIDNDGMHAPRERNGQIALLKGAQTFALDFIEGGGGFTLKLQYSLNGSEPKEVPASWFKH